jgi:hypothetical protein
MTEINNDSKFFKRARAAAIGVGITASAALAAQGATTISNGINKSNETQAGIEAEDTHEKAIIESLTGQFDEALVIGDAFSIEQGGGLETPALAEIERVYGEQFENLKPLIYNDLQTAAKYQIMPQPGETFVVVEFDVDPELDNGKEYLPVRTTQIIRGDDVQLETLNTVPSPTQR